ncbi:hypothetical protein B7494_g2056 [Chlorociboria aeruginascens]|nr:hypothetical protein B7494_g2056 [Chlorociboria aeruginascens]
MTRNTLYSILKSETNPELHKSEEQAVMNIVEWAFGKRMTPAERLRKHQRSLEKAQRELDRERVKLENQEKKLIQDIKKSAKAGQMGPCKVQAKDLVRTRRYIEKFYSMRTQLQAISLRIQTVRTNEQMMQAMKGATGVLGSMNRSMNLPALQRIAMEFERENDIMDQRQEMMDDAIDDVTGLEDEAEGEEVVEQVLEEIGIDLKTAMGETPSGLQSNAVAEGKVAQAVGAGGADPGDSDLQARLDSLRRSDQHTSPPSLQPYFTKQRFVLSHATNSSIRPCSTVTLQISTTFEFQSANYITPLKTAGLDISNISRLLTRLAN